MLELWATVLLPITTAVEAKSVLLVGTANGLAQRFADHGVEVAELGDVADHAPASVPDMAVIADGRGATVLTVFEALRARSAETGAPLPVIVVGLADDHGTASEHGPAAAVSAIRERDPRLDVTVIPGLGGAALVAGPAARERAPALEGTLRALTPSRELGLHIAALEAERRLAVSRARMAEKRHEEVRDELATAQVVAGERDRLRASLPVLAAARARGIERTARAIGPPAPASALEQEAEEHVRLRLAALRAGADDLARPRPRDVQGRIADPDELDTPLVLVRATRSPDELAECVWSIVARTDRRIRVTVAVPAEASAQVRIAAESLAAAAPGISTIALAGETAASTAAEGSGAWTAVLDRPVPVPHGWTFRLAAHVTDGTRLAIPGRGASPAATVGAEAIALACGQQLISDPDPPGFVAGAGALLSDATGDGPAAWVVDDRVLGPGPDNLDIEDSLRKALTSESVTIAYVLRGVPPGGSGGAISVLQEAAELGRLGVDVLITMPDEAIGRASTFYPRAVPWLRGVASDEDLRAALSGARVVIATEAGTVDEVAELAPSGALRAYYVQDYEALFGRPGTPHADAALLSYRRASWGGAFAKTHWLVNLVESAHQVPVGKVEPSLDRDVFHAHDRVDGQPGFRVLGMIRPRTPRRRPAATLALLERLSTQFGGEIECVSFGCEAEELDELVGGRPLAGISHLGLLGRDEVGEVMRRCDAFVDLSIYQAFGRSGLEAMACGAVPVLPRLGGVTEYAIDGRNAVLADGPEDAYAAVVQLLEDRARMSRLRSEGIRTAQRFSVLRAAISQYVFLTEAVRMRREADGRLDP